MKNPRLRVAHVFALAALLPLAALVACGGDPAEAINPKPDFLGEITVQNYAAADNDLLTAGLGKTGLMQAAPTVANPAQPSALELRRLAIYSNYRALLDPTTAGGFGVLYGPNIDSKGGDSLGEGKIFGKEYITYADDGTGQQNVTMLVQVPASFNPANACIVTATSSGSRGVYGAIATAGEWGLKHGCAVAYTDKGTGNALYDIQNDTVSLQDGTRSAANAANSAGKKAAFLPTMNSTERTTFNTATPNRVALKHAHSQQNPEKDWGKWTLQAVDFAYYVLNEQFSPLAKDGKRHTLTLTSKNTLVLASSVSNGGGAALAALEQDSRGVISGLAVGEPNVQLPNDNRLAVVRGNQRLQGTGKPLYDYFTLANLLQPCAALAPSASTAPIRASFNVAQATARCQALAGKGLIKGNSLDELSNSALAALLAAGFEPESRDLHAAMFTYATPAIVATYSNAYGKFSALENLCGLSFIGDTSKLPLLFGLGSGIAPTNGVGIMNNQSVGGPALDMDSTSASTGKKDFDVDAALCQRDLFTGTHDAAKRVQAGITQVQRSANLRGKPAVIVHGRADTLIPVGFSSRPYFGMNKMVEGANSKLSYIEVTNAQHFDAFLPIPGFDNRYVPLHVYFNQAMEMLYAHLKSGAALPVSQVVRTNPRQLDGAGKLLPLSSSNVPPISLAPKASDMILFNANVVTIPD